MAGVGIHPVEGSSLGPGGQPVARKVQEDDPVALDSQVGGQPPVHVGVHQDAVEKDQHPRALPVDLVVQLEIVVDEEADFVRCR